MQWHERERTRYLAFLAPIRKNNSPKLEERCGAHRTNANCFCYHLPSYCFSVNLPFDFHIRASSIFVISHTGYLFLSVTMSVRMVIAPRPLWHARCAVAYGHGFKFHDHRRQKENFKRQWLFCNIFTKFNFRSGNWKQFLLCHMANDNICDV